MKLILVILITGIILTIASIASFSYSSITVFEKYPNTEILLAGETVESFSSISGLVEIDFPRDFFLGVRTIPQGQQLILSLSSENGEEIITAPIEETFFEKLSAVESGWYVLEITSFSTEPVNVYAVITAHDMRENFHTIAELGNFLIIGFVLFLPGIVLILVGCGFLIYTKTKKNNQLQS